MVEPPVLQARIMTFVFAAALAVLVVLVIALSNMLPLARTQIFFLTTQPTDAMQIEITPFSPATDMNAYTENFIKEYIKQRNEIFPVMSQMKRKWAAATGDVYLMSDADVFAAFAKTHAFRDVMTGAMSASMRCPVEFTGIRPYDAAARKFLVDFRYFCSDNTGQTNGKDYTILVGIDFAPIENGQKLENPLGMIVNEYTPQNGANDPLNEQDNL